MVHVQLILLACSEKSYIYMYMITVPTKQNKHTYVLYHIFLTFPMPCMLSRIAGDKCMMSVHVFGAVGWHCLNGWVVGSMLKKSLGLIISNCPVILRPNGLYSLRPKIVIR